MTVCWLNTEHWAHIFLQEWFLSDNKLMSLAGSDFRSICHIHDKKSINKPEKLSSVQTRMLFSYNISLYQKLFAINFESFVSKDSEIHKCWNVNVILLFGKMSCGLVSSANGVENSKLSKSQSLLLAENIHSSALEISFLKLSTQIAYHMYHRQN